MAKKPPKSPLSSEMAKAMAMEAMDALAHGVIYLDEQGRIVWANRIACANLGYSRREILSLTVFDIDPALPPEFWPAHWQEVRSRGSLALETCHQGKDGKLIPVEVQVHFVKAGGLEFTCGLIRDISGRRRQEDVVERYRDEMERRLKEREESFRAIFETSPDAILVAEGATGKFLLANQAACRLLGYQMAELMTLGVEDIHPHHNLPMIRETFNAMSRGGRSMANDVPCLRKDGEVVFVDISGAPIIIDGRQCTIGFFRDITARRQTDEALRENEEKFRKLVDEASFDGYIVHAKGKISDVSRRFADMYGYTRQELIGKDILETIDPDYRQVVRQRVDRGSERAYLARGLRKDGSTFPIEIHAKNLELQGQMVRTAAVRDISAQEQAQQELREAEERYRTLFEHAGDAVILLEAREEHFGDIVEANQAAADMHGYSAQEMVGLNITDLLIPQAASRIPGRMAKMRSGEWIKFDDFHRRKDGSRFPMEISAGLVTLGGHPYVLAFERDISQRRQEEQARRELETQLFYAQKMKAVGTMAGGVAHDFNNFLQVLQGHLHLILDSQAGEETKDAARQIEKAAQRAAGLVRRLLTFSRKDDHLQKPLDLNEQLAEIIKMLGPTLPKMVSMQSHLRPDAAWVKADPGQLEQVMVNLATNDRDAMPEGGLLRFSTQRVTLDEDFCRSRPHLSPGEHVLLCVTDSGKGMDQATQEQIFEPFFTTKDKEQGTGLGLSTVYGIVRSHSGHIECSSQPERGTTFRIYLPALSGPPSRPRPRAEPEAPLGRGETVLLVDDEEGILHTTGPLLSRHGYQVITAARGEEALQLISQRGAEIDLVIMDLSMPGMGGKACLARLREQGSKVKVLIASGYLAEGSDQELTQLGADGFLSKPYRLNNLLGELRQALAGP